MAVLTYSDDFSSNAPLSGILFRQIQKDILTGELIAGEKLTEQRICDRYKVSRTPVREALRQLEKESLIENIPNRGAFVIGFSNQDILDMFDLRASYEVLAVEWAIERMTDKELEAFEETFEFMEFYTMKKDIEKMLNININFHRNLHHATHNRMIQQTLSSYQLYIKYTNRRTYDNPEEYLSTVLEEHRRIFEAVKSRNTELGISAMRDKMEKSKERRMEHM